MVLWQAVVNASHRRTITSSQTRVAASQAGAYCPIPRDRSNADRQLGARRTRFGGRPKPTPEEILSYETATAFQFLRAMPSRSRRRAR
jgi:hypothetical protein